MASSACGFLHKPEAILAFKQFPECSWAAEEVVPNQNAISTIILSRVAVPLLAMLLGAGPANAQNASSSNYTFLVASGFLCDPGDSATCPAVVRSANGDSYEMTGAGTFDAQSKSVTATGTFAHKSSDGTVLETGVWIVNDLVKFSSYGMAPNALLHQERALGPTSFNPKHPPVSSSGSIPTGGLALFHIRLLPIRGTAKSATLQVNCALGDPPRERQAEGVQLTFEGNAGEFSEEVSGRAMFLSLR
jgi:hypothetical protein